MRRLWVILAIVACATPAAFYFTHVACVNNDCDEVTWLTREFNLNAEQAEKLAVLIKNYEPVCASHCSEIAVARQRLVVLAKEGKKDTQDYSDALKEWRALTGTCNEATRAHVQAVAALMNPDQSRRYLELVMPMLEEQAQAAPHRL